MVIAALSFGILRAGARRPNAFWALAAIGIFVSGYVVGDVTRHAAERLAQEPIRLQVVQRVLAGESISELARILGYSRQAIYNCVSAYEVGGKAALRATKALGATAKLTEKQTEWLAKTLISKNPAQMQFPCALWTREIVRELIKRRFRVKMALTSVGNLLRRLGFTVQRPLIRAYERNPVAVKRWLNVEYPEIRSQAKNEQAVIFFGDESGI